MHLVWFQWYEEAYLAVGGFRKVVPEELQDDDAMMRYFSSVCLFVTFYVSAEKLSFSPKGQFGAPVSDEKSSLFASVCLFLTFYPHLYM